MKTLRGLHGKKLSLPVRLLAVAGTTPYFERDSMTRFSKCATTGRAACWS